MQYWDPSPIYAANDYLMPPNSQMFNQRKARKKDMRPDNKRIFSIGLSGFVQAASRAYDWYGCNTYQSWCGNNNGLTEGGLGNQMGDFRGTLAAMPLFLGNDPNGNSIWDTNINYVNSTATPTKNIFLSQTDTRLITSTSINKTQLPDCLKEIVSIFSGVTSPEGTPQSSCPPDNTSPKSEYAFLFVPNGVTPTTTPTIPSIFTAGELAQDPTYFGAFSLPLEYRKGGLRFEIGIDPADWVGITIQSGFVTIQQTTTGLQSMTAALAAAQSANAPSTLNLLNLPSTNLYGELYSQEGSATPISSPSTDAQDYFDEYISNNIDEILSSKCGLNINTCNFDCYSVEDVRILLNFKHTYDVDRYTKNDDDEFNWPDMLFTPYVWIGGSIPVAEKQNYRKLLSLPFGNNGHASVGGAVGFMFDFVDSIEVGFEAGGTYFLPQTICRPVPNHPLQRVVYPYWTNVKVQPGTNSHFKLNMNAYQFMNHISFWATYEYIQHRKDCYSLRNTASNTITKTLTATPVAVTEESPSICTNATALTVGTVEEQIFYPEVLRCNSDWRMQFLNMGLVFDIQPGMQAGFVWQQPISPRNAYYPVSLLATFSFMF